MEWLLAIIALLVGLGGGYYVSGLTKSNKQSESGSKETNIDASLQYGKRFQYLQLWKQALSDFHTQLVTAHSVEELLDAFIGVISDSISGVNLVIAVGPIRDIVLLQYAHDIKQEISNIANIHTKPELPKDQSIELVSAIYEQLKHTEHSHKKWWFLKDLNASLQSNLYSRYKLMGNAIVIPINCNNTVCGIILISDKSFVNVYDNTADAAQFCVMFSEVITTWLYTMAPQVLASSTKSPASILPVQAMATINSFENTITQLQMKGTSKEILKELNDFSRSIDEPNPELSLLAIESASSLSRICQADFILFLNVLKDTATKQYTFQAEAIWTSDWTWSRANGMSNDQVNMPFKKSDLENFQEDFLVESATNLQVIEAKTSGEMTNYSPRLAKDYNLSAMITIPVIMRGKCIQQIIICRKEQGGFSEEIIMAAQSEANIIALSATLLYSFDELARLQEQLTDTWKLASKVTSQSIDLLQEATHIRDMLTLRNSIEISKYAEKIALELNLPPIEASHIRLAALLCDIGMISIPTTILLKEGSLTSDELALIHEHPKKSAEILGKLDVLKGSLQIVLYHHESYDGTGYPYQVRGELIPFGARILAVADSYVSMQTPRPYRQPFTQLEALQSLREQMGKKYDPTVVTALIKLLKKESQQEKAA